MSYEILLKSLWSDIYDPQKNFDETFEHYFHKNYSQCINGVQLNRNEYKTHVLEQRKNMTLHHIEYKHILEQENQLFALYYPEGTNNHNQPIRGEVIAYFQFEGQHILHTHGQVRLIQGNLADVGMKEENA